MTKKKIRTIVCLRLEFFKNYGKFEQRAAINNLIQLSMSSKLFRYI